MFQCVDFSTRECYTSGMDEFEKKQRDHQYAEMAIDDDNNITIWALGGFVPENVKEATEFLKGSPPYKPSFAPFNKPAKTATIIKQENEFRLGLVSRMNEFLRVLRDTRCSVRRAAKVSGLNRMLADAMRHRVPTFNQLWQEIYMDATDELEDAAFARAVDGVTKGVYWRGDLVAEEKTYSDALLSMMLQGRKSEIYKNRTATELSGDPNAPIKYETASREMTKDEIIAELVRRGLPTTVFDKG